MKTPAIIMSVCLAMPAAAYEYPPPGNIKFGSCADEKFAPLCDAAEARIAALKAHDIEGLKKVVMCDERLRHKESNGRRRAFCGPDSFVHAMESCGPDGLSDPRVGNPDFVMAKGGGFSFAAHGFDRGEGTIIVVQDGSSDAVMRYRYANVLRRCTILPAGSSIPDGGGSQFFRSGAGYGDYGPELQPGTALSEPTFVVEQPRSPKAAVGLQTWWNPVGAQWVLMAHEAIPATGQDLSAFSQLYRDGSKD